MRASSMEMPVQIRGVLEPPEYHDFRLYFGKGAVVRGSASREYAVLKNSLIVQQPSGDHDERIIKISCDASFVRYNYDSQIMPCTM
jgi:hypothetical protein